ncbi:MAG: RDD family protein [Bacteroidetes bacterium]|nr:RDD family protein [Bacteroidota bacterium]
MLIDGILMVILMFIAAWVMGNMKMDEEQEGVIKAITFACIWGVYEPVCMISGATLGNYLIGIRVRKYSDTNKRISIFQAYVRFIVKVLLGWISFLTIGMNKERRAIHDLVAGTVMIEKI